MDLKLISGIEGDLITDDFDKLKASQQVQNLLKAFENRTDRLDQLFNIDIGEIVQLSDATKKFVNIIFTLYHGNASVERGFSVNKNCINDNLLDESLVARRMVCDTVSRACGPNNVPIAKSLILACKNSNALYRETLKRKRELQNEENDLRVKKIRLAKEIKELEASMDKIDRESEKKKADINDKIAAVKLSLSKKC